MTQQDYKDLKELLSTRKKIVITTHKNPDGDAMGSSLGLYNYLKDQHDVVVITPNNYPEFLHWLPGNEYVVDYESQPDFSGELCEKADLIFSLDYNTLERIEHLGHFVSISKAKKILIDHHLQPGDFADIVLSDITACSTAQLIYEFITSLDSKTSITKDIATCLYTGILTDTGSFRFDSTTAHVHHIVADLIEAGAKNSWIHQQIYDTNTFERLKFVGFCISEKMVVLDDLPVAYISITKKELEKYNNRKGDSEGLVNYPLSIKGVKVAALFIERENVVKISFRSKGEFSVNALSRAHFTGGGHRNAAGGMSSETLDETVNRFLKVIREYTSELV